ncbi:carotenoid oxygenase family protein [Streptomyces violaceusniger]|uniref:carotenoid oxygenase family protein n=1 Tax=Streptomyces violaceusniger TaxID=68280 RepID=UPI0001E4DF7B|nr:carotenoid oxygenase family protein [Streptomyces violaceusniger]
MVPQPLGADTGPPQRHIVLDARDITAASVATVELPHRVPAGIHGSWIPAPATGP